MNSMVTAAVTTPRAMQASSPERLNSDGRGRTTTSMITPAQASRSQAAPSGWIRSSRPTDTARPSCTHSIAASAMSAPERAEGEGATGVRVVATPPVQRGGIVHVH
jgi:hypothetical protein